MNHICLIIAIYSYDFYWEHIGRKRFESTYIKKLIKSSSNKEAWKKLFP